MTTYYTWSGTPIAGSRGVSSLFRTEFTSVQTAFATVNSEMVLKAPLASPTFTGTPTAPTAAAGTNTTQIATTEFVQSAAFAAALPAISGAVTDYFPTNNGSTGSWSNLLKTGTIRFADSTDTTKRLAFDASGVTSGQTRTATVPDYSGTLSLRAKGADIASAATVNLDTATGDYAHITGTTTITAVTLASGTERTVIFDGSLTLTHNATTLILPGSANITTAAGDRATFRGDGAGVCCIHYTRASAAITASGLTQSTARLLGRTTAGTGAIEELSVSGATLSGGTLTITPPSVTLITTITPSASAAVNALNVFTADYDAYLILCEGITPAVSDTLRMQFATGGALDTGNNYRLNTSNSSAAAGALTSAISLGNNQVGSAGRGANLVIKVVNANSTRLKSAIVEISYESNVADDFRNDKPTGVYVAANAISGFGLSWVGGNNFQALGAIRIYGIKNS